MSSAPLLASKAQTFNRSILSFRVSACSERSLARKHLTNPAHEPISGHNILR